MAGGNTASNLTRCAATQSRYGGVLCTIQWNSNLEFNTDMFHNALTKGLWTTHTRHRNLAVANSISSFLGFIFSLNSLRLGLQSTCFALPTLLSPVISFGLLAVRCWAPVLDSIPYFEVLCPADITGHVADPTLITREIVAFVLFFLAFTIAIRHIVTNKATPTTQKQHNYFPRPGYTGTSVGGLPLSCPATAPAHTTLAARAEHVLFICVTLYHEHGYEVDSMAKSLKDLCLEVKLSDWKVTIIVVCDDTFLPNGEYNATVQQWHSHLLGNEPPRSHREAFGEVWQGELPSAERNEGVDVWTYLKDPSRVAVSYPGTRSTVTVTGCGNE